MDLPSELRHALLEAKELVTAGKMLEAERIYRALAASGPHRAVALEALADLLIDQQRAGEVLVILRELRDEDPENLRYVGVLAGFYESVGEIRAASDEYAKFLSEQPNSAVAHFNHALLLRKQQRGEEAIAAYKAALALDIEQPEEVYVNMGVTYSDMHDAEAATEMYQRSLDIAPDYLPALFNLAGHYEELGEAQPAIDHYERILAIDPNHWQSLARLAYPRKVTGDNRDVIERLQQGVERSREDAMAQEALQFALGKAYDDVGEYDAAATAYTNANEVGKRRMSPYNPEGTEAAFDNLISIFDRDWVERNATESEATPVFICGMYRSGSTLLERMLDAHPDIEAGGELSVLGWLTSQFVGAFPSAAADANREQLTRIADEYAAAVSKLRPEAKFVLDKQPDNFLRVGLIRAVFPKAKIIQTRRDVRDNCLSIYFQQFGKATNYAADLAHCEHYYRQQERLFEHWKSLSSDSIMTVDYEALVEDPEPLLRQVTDMIGVEWDPAVLDFHQKKGLVKTASIWQVRQALNTGSRGRWQNYSGLLTDAGFASESA